MNFSLWKTVYILLCAGLFLAAITTLGFIFLSPDTGWDYKVYMGSIDALSHGQNPYDHNELKNYITVGSDDPLFAYGYPPHTLLIFWFISLFNNIGIYRIFCILLILIGSYIALSIEEKRDYLFFGILLTTGFISMYWNFLTGNDSIIFFFFTAIIYLGLPEKVTIDDKKPFVTDSSNVL